MNSVAFILYIISFLDSVCFGLIMPVLPTHILTLGGTHTILGLHGMLHASLYLFSDSFSRKCADRFGKKITLKTTLFLGVIANVLMGFYSSYLIIIGLRVIYYLTNQTQNQVKSLVSDLQSKENQSGVFSTLNILGISGFIIGPILGGYIYEQINGYFYLSLLTGILSYISLVLTNFLPRDIPVKDKKEDSSFKRKFLGDIQLLRNIDTTKNGKVLLLRLLTSFGLTIFFIKFSLLLKVHYMASHSLVGWTIAYQNVTMFLSTVTIPFIENKVTVRNVSKLRRFLAVLAISVTAICFSPIYEMYLVSFIPLAVAKTFVELAWKEIESTQEKDSAQLSDALKMITNITSIFAPVILGVFCDVYVQNAVKFLTVVPLVSASFLGSYYYIGSVKSSDKKK